MASPLVISPPSPYSIAAPLGVQKARRRLSDGSMAIESDLIRPSLITTNEEELSKIQNQQDQFMRIVGGILGFVFFLASLIIVLLLYSPDVAADETRTTFAGVVQSSNEGGPGVDENTVIVPLETVRPHRSTSTESTRTEPKRTTPAMTDTERKTETLSTGVSTVSPHTSTPVRPVTTDKPDVSPDTAFPTDTPQVSTENPQGPRGPFLCTVSVNLTESTLFPEDGVCDIIFYESFYVKNKPYDWSDTGLDHFFELARSMQRTSIGASFSPESGELIAEHESGQLYAGLDKLRIMGVKHFGILNLLAGMTTLAGRIQVLKILSSIVRYVNSDAEVVYAVLGVYFPHHYAYLRVGYLRELFRPTHFIAITHLSAPESYGSCDQVYPMSMMTFPRDLEFRPTAYVGPLSIEEALSSLEWLKRNKLADMRFYISFSMRAHYYTVNESRDATRNYASIGQGEEYFHLFKSCAYFHEYGYQGDLHTKEVCAEQYGNYYSYNTTVKAEYTFNPQENRILVFDSEKGLKERVCAAFIQDSSLVFSLAAYDIDYDQESEACPNLFIGRGSFRRVKTLRFMSGYRPELDDRFWIDPQVKCTTKRYTDVGNPCCPGS